MYDSMGEYAEGSAAVADFSAVSDIFDIRGKDWQLITKCPTMKGMHD